MDTTIRQTLQKFWHDLIQQERQHLRNNIDKPRQPKTEIIYRHPHSRLQDSTSIRCARLRRHEIWNYRHSNNHQQRQHPLDNFQQQRQHPLDNFRRDARELLCPLDPGSDSQTQPCPLWIEQQILQKETNQQQAQLQARKQRLRGKPRAIWQWLARDKRAHANYFRSAARSCRSQTILAKYLAH